MRNDPPRFTELDADYEILQELDVSTVVAPFADVRRPRTG